MTSSVLNAVLRSCLRIQRQYRRDKTLVLKRPLDHEWGVAGWKPKNQIEVSLHQLLPFIESDAVELNSKQMRDLLWLHFNPQKRNADSIRRALDTVRAMSEQVKLDQCSSRCVTNGIQIDVTSAFYSCVKCEQDQSNKSYIFSYRVAIQYSGDNTIQLKSRNWLLQESGKEWIDIMPRGSPGVVGLFPMFGQNSKNKNLVFEYTSSCISSTPMALMKGSFQMINSGTNTSFDAEIAPFRLISSQ
eukprot:g3729.t1